MVLIGVLCLLVLLGLVAIARWGHLDLERPWDNDTSWPQSPRESLRRYLWYVTITVAAAIVSGLIMIGAGGRLAMRLLAITAGDAAQGRVTEADQIVGRITLDGTMGFIGFFGVFGGLVLGFLYMLVRRWLPRGRWDGLVYGAMLLVVAGTRVEPLRANNVDFIIVGPGWVAVTVYTALGLAYGMLVAALVGRYSRSLPLITKEPRTLVRYAPILLIGPVFPVAIPIVVIGLFALLLGRTDGLNAIASSRRVLSAGRIVGVVGVAIAAPGFASAIADIATR